MHRLKKIFIALLLALWTPMAKADTGCKSSMSNNLYYDPAGVSYGGATVYEKSPKIDFGSAYCTVATGSICYIRTTVSSECPGCPSVWSWSDWTYWYYMQGTTYTFSFVNCPLDDYVSWLLLSIAGFGFVLIKKRVLHAV